MSTQILISCDRCKASAPCDALGSIPLGWASLSFSQVKPATKEEVAEYLRANGGTIVAVEVSRQGHACPGCAADVLAFMEGR